MESVTHDNVIAFLQEYCQQNRLPLPVYDEVCQNGVDHCKQFTMRCKFAEYSVTGTDSTKKSAKKIAAKNMVKFLQEKDYFNNSKKAGTKIPPKEEIDGGETNNMEVDNGLNMNFVAPDNVIAFLQEYCQQCNLPLPVYGEVVQKGEDHCKVFTMQCQFGEFSITGTDRNKKLAKKDAAKNMFKFLQEKGYFKNVHPSMSKVGIQTQPEVHVGQTTNNVNVISGVNSIGALQEYCVKFLPLNTFPIYQDVIGASPFFTVSCNLLQHITYGSGPQKKIAKSAAAAAMINKLREERVEKCGVMEPKMISQPIEIPTVNMNIDAVDEIDSTQPPTKRKMGDENIDSSTSENGLGDELPMGEVKRFRNLYHKMKNTDPVKWLKMFCDYRAIDSYFSVKNSEKGTGKVFTIDIPSELIKIDWEEQAEEQARKECSKVVGFMLLMKHMNEYKNILKKNRQAETSNTKKYERSQRSQELKSFVNLENWLNFACQESGVTFPVFEYQLVEGFYHVTCRLLQHAITGIDESKKKGKHAVVIKMQIFLLEAADVKETDDDLVKSQKVVDFMKRTSNEQQVERQVNLDEVIESYKRLTINNRDKATRKSTLFDVEYSLLQGPAVTRIVNINVDEIDNHGFKYIEELVREQNLTMKIEYNDMLYDRKMNSPIVRKLRDNYKGKFSCFILIQKLNGRQLTFMGVGTTKTESFEQAVVMALSQLKIFLFTTMSEIENLIFIDSLKNIFPASSKELDLPTSQLSFH